MKKYVFLALIVFLAGCAQVRTATDWLASDKTRQAAANLKTFATAFDCGLVVSSAALSQTIAGVVDAGEAAIGTTGKVYAVSAAICLSLGGTPSTAPVAVK